MASSEETGTGDGRERDCTVREIRSSSVLLDPDSPEPRFVVPREILPDDLEVGDRLEVSTRRLTPLTCAGDIFSEAEERLRGLRSRWDRPGLAEGESRASA